MLSNYEIGARIKTARELRGFTLDAVATSVGVAKSTIQRYEKGSIAKIKLPVIESIANSLHVNPNWLIGNIDDPSPVSPSAPASDALILTQPEEALVRDYRQLNEKGQEQVRNHVKFLNTQDEYKKISPSTVQSGMGA